MANSDAAGLPDFRGSEATKAWLRGQSREVGAVLTARAALRVLPLTGGGDLGGISSTRVAAVLAMFRNAAASWRGIKSPKQQMILDTRGWPADESWAVSTVDEAINTISFHEKPESNFAAAEAIDFAACADAAAVSLTGKVENDSRPIAPHSAAVRTDAAAILGGEMPESVACSRLWPEGAPDWATKAWSTLKSYLLAANEGWEVWTEWYDARLRGDPFDTDLERARVLIPEDIWQQGPKAVNAEIARLVAARREAAHSAMLDRIAALEAQLAAPRAEGPAPIGHNNPPETIKDEIQPSLDALKRQPVTPDDPAEAVAAVGRLRTVLSRITGYVGRKLDIFIDEAMKEGGREFGRWAIRVPLAAVVGAAIVWLGTLGVPL